MKNRMPKVGDVFGDRTPKHSKTTPSRELTVEVVGEDVVMCRSSARNQLVAIQFDRLQDYPGSRYKLIKEGP